MTQTASGAVAARAPRARTLMGSLAWAYLAALHRSDALRANQLLIAFQQQWVNYGDYVLEGYPSTTRARYHSLPVNGRWEPRTAERLALALRATHGRDAEALGTAASATAAAELFRSRLLETAPMGDEGIWGAYTWAQEVSPWDVSRHVGERGFGFVEGLEDGAGEAQLPAQVQDAGVPVGQGHVYQGEAIDVSAYTSLRPRSSHWPWVVAGAGVATLGVILIWRKWWRK